MIIKCEDKMIISDNVLIKSDSNIRNERLTYALIAENP